MRCRALFAFLFPPRESLCLVRCPEEAGIGATPASAANEALLVRRSGLSPAATSSVSICWSVKIRGRGR